VSIIEFLTARLDEDEAVARDALDDLDLDGDGSEWTTGHFDHTMTSNPSALFIRSRSPEQALADVAAKRAIVAECIEHTDEDAWERDRVAASELAYATLRLLAQPYADHPDYDEGWRP
jgi:hypothetical protein